MITTVAMLNTLQILTVVSELFYFREKLVI